MSAQQSRFQINDFLGHILESIRRIESYTANQTFEDFRRNTRDQDAVIRNLEVIGEASRNIEKHFPDFAAQHPELPIQSAYDMRNALSHGYFGVDVALVWQAVQRDLPALKNDILAILPISP